MARMVFKKRRETHQYTLPHHLRGVRVHLGMQGQVKAHSIDLVTKSYSKLSSFLVIGQCTEMLALPTVIAESHDHAASESRTVLAAGVAA